MKFNKQIIITLVVAFLSCFGITIKENVPNPNMNSVNYSKVASGCSPATSQTDIDINNVRATILLVVICGGIYLMLNTKFQKEVV